tara:strand:+ start:577 stop:828 length:252 start_codon:yes stop_codon:yes gene_type:complete
MSNQKFYLSFYFEKIHRTFTVQAATPDNALKKVMPKARLWARSIKLNNPWKNEFQCGPKLTRMFLEDGTVLVQSKGIGTPYAS